MAAKICSKSCLDRTGASGLQSANGLLPLVVLTFSTLCFVCFLVHFILLAPTQRKHTFLFHVHIYRFVQKHGPRQFFRDIVDGLPFRYNYAATLKCSNDYVLCSKWQDLHDTAGGKFILQAYSFELWLSGWPSWEMRGKNICPRTSCCCSASS